MKPHVPTVLLFLTVCISVSSTGQQANAQRNIFFAEKGCPLVSIFPVVGSAVALRNIGQKTVASYKLACFRRGAKQPRAEFVFEESFENILPNEVTEEGSFDATPPNACRWRKELIGVYEVKFSDGTLWNTAGGR